jgi:hypothetical protein
MILGYLAERVCQPVPTVVAGGYPNDAEITWAGGAGPLVTLLREYGNLCQLVVAGDYPIDAEIAGECVRGYPAERICQPVQLVVAGDHTI